MAGGYLRRGELAVALTRKASCLIADEPQAGVEPKYRQVVASLLRAQADAGAAILVTGHDAPELLDLADDVIWMTAGTTHGLGSSDQAQRHEQFCREYLGTRS
jgi:ABC-type branched-subunit amino acid transport system ATPase component